MESAPDDSLHLKECECDECNEMKNMRLRGGCDDCNEVRRLSGGRNPCPCPEPVPEPVIQYIPQMPICPTLPEAGVVRTATPEEEGCYDEFEANLNGTGITIRVLKNSHTVTNVLDSENEDSGCEMSNEICGKVNTF